MFHYRPCLGWKAGEDGIRRQHRFNLGTDRKEAELRMARLRELWAENEKVIGEPTWTPFVLSCANQIAQGNYRIAYHFDADDVEQLEDPATEYVQTINTLRADFPSLEIVPADQELYAESLQLNDQLQSQAMKFVEGELKLPCCQELCMLKLRQGPLRHLTAQVSGRRRTGAPRRASR